MFRPALAGLLGVLLAVSVTVGASADVSSPPPLPIAQFGYNPSSRLAVMPREHLPAFEWSARSASTFPNKSMASFHPLRSTGDWINFVFEGQLYVGNSYCSGGRDCSVSGLTATGFTNSVSGGKYLCQKGLDGDIRVVSRSTLGWQLVTDVDLTVSQQIRGAVAKFGGASCDDDEFLVGIMGTDDGLGVTSSTGNGRIGFAALSPDLNLAAVRDFVTCTGSTRKVFLDGAGWDETCPNGVRSVGRYFGSSSTSGALFEWTVDGSIYDQLQKCLGDSESCRISWVLPDGTICDGPDSTDLDRRRCRDYYLANGWDDASCTWVQAATVVTAAVPASYGIMPMSAIPIPMDCEMKERLDSAISDLERNDPMEPELSELRKIREEIQGLREDTKSGVDRMVEAMKTGQTPGAPGDGSGDGGGDGDGGGSGGLMPSPDDATNALSYGDLGVGTMQAKWAEKTGPWKKVTEDVQTAFVVGECSCDGWSVDLPSPGGSVATIEIGNTCTGFGAQAANVSKAASSALLMVGGGLVGINFVMQGLGYSGFGREVNGVVKMASNHRAAAEFDARRARNEAAGA